MINKAIGIFDSGIGGLSVLSPLVKLLPKEHYIYFADTANLPYGNKSKEDLIKISSNVFDFFKSKNVKAVIMACNTTSANVYEILKSNYEFEIYPILQSVSKYIANKNFNSIGVFATSATVNSHAYMREIQKHNNKTKVFEMECPDWVQIVEKSLFKEDNSIQNIKKMVDLMMKKGVDKIILGCTHFPFLLEVLSEFASRDIFIDPGEYFSEFIAEDMKNKNLLNKEGGANIEFYSSSEPEQFEKSASRFYPVKNVKLTPLVSLYR